MTSVQENQYLRRAFLVDVFGPKIMNSTEERKRREIEKNNRENNNDKLGKRKYGKCKRGEVGLK